MKDSLSGLNIYNYYGPAGPIQDAQAELNREYWSAAPQTLLYCTLLLTLNFCL